MRLKYYVPEQPRQVRLDTTTNCNAFCLSCHRFLKPARKGQMPISMAKDILKSIAGWSSPLQELVPVNHGELFLYSRWAELLALVDNILPNTRVVIPTNGSLFTRDVVLELSRQKCVKLINFSINAFLPETYKCFTGLPATTPDLIREAAILLIRIRPDITLWFSMVYDPLYQSEMEKDLFIQEWRKLGTPQIIPASNCDRQKQEIEVSLPCRSLFSDLVIGFDGKISSCCFDARFWLDLGQLDGAVLSAWKSPKLEELRKLHNEGRRSEVNLCKRCSFA
mgnify:CR=1 FL=1